MLSQLLADHAALQRALGYKFRTPGILLRNFVTFAECRGERVITTATVREWALKAPSPEQRRNRLLSVRRFALALHAEDPRHEVPSSDLFGRASHRRRTPHIYRPEDSRCSAGQCCSVNGIRTRPDILVAITVRAGGSLRIMADTLQPRPNGQF